jgi:LacI family transcriptional regulator
MAKTAGSSAEGEVSLAEGRRRGRGRKGPPGLTIKDIAREAGVSTATVSRALNRPEKVSRATRETIEGITKRHHFVSHGLATGLASQRSGLLGLVIPTLSNSIYSQSTHAIQDVAQAAGFTVLVGVSDFSQSIEERLIHRFIEHRVEGLVLTGTDRDPEIYDKILHNGLTYVLTWKLDAQRRHPSVSFDNTKAAVTAVEHLIALGHRRIGFVCGHTKLNDRALERRQAFESTMRRHALEPDPELMFERAFEYIEGNAAMRQIMEHANPPTAVFCANDIQAIGALAYCLDAGVRVPGDVSLVGFDDLPITQYTTPKLTTVHVPAADMGRRAAQQLVAAIRDGQSPTSLELPTQLIVRGSTAPPAQAGTPELAAQPHGRRA